MVLRASPGRVRVSVHSTNIDRLLLPGGDLWGWQRRVGLETMFTAIAYAPSRSGYLKTQHGMTQTPIGRRHVRTTVHNDADYARFVAGGTQGPIRSTRPGGSLLVRPAPHSRFARFVPLKEVDGQPANNWIGKAQEDVLARHGIR